MGEKAKQMIFNFFIRATVGMCTIFLANQVCVNKEIPVMVGMNLCSFLTAGTLGIPGVGLLYGILLYQLL